MTHDAHNLQFPILCGVRGDGRPSTGSTTTDLETFILQNTFNGSVLPAGGHFRLEDHAKGAVSYNFALRILHVPGFSGESILDLFTNHFYIFEPTQLWSNVVGRGEWGRRRDQRSLTPHAQTRKHPGSILGHDEALA